MRWRAIALPPEHGSWGLVLEPIALGLLVAPSLAGLFCGLSAFAAFLMRRPFKVAWTQRKRPADPRVRAAALVLVSYGAVFLAAFAITFAIAGWRPLLPLVIVSPLLLVFLAYDLENQSRAGPAELAGAVVFSAVPAGIALAAGWPWAPAAALGAVLIARAIPSILYVRSRIRLDRGRKSGRWTTMAAHGAALAAVVALAWAELLPALSLLALVAMLLRAGVGLSERRPAQSMRSVGLTEMALGILTLVAVSVGYWTGV